MSILFLDDHPGLRDGTALILSQKNPKLKFFCAGTTDEAVELLRSHIEISIALVDLNLEGENGLDSVKKTAGNSKRFKNHYLHNVRGQFSCKQFA